MPDFIYKGTNAQGKTVSGTLSAMGERDLYDKLKADGIFADDIRLKVAKKKQIKLPPKAVSEFCQSVGTLVASGVTLVRALSIASQEENTKPEYRAVYAELLRQVRQGGVMSEAMEDQGEAFPQMLIYMVRSAESSGSMDKVLLRMADHYEKEYKLKGKISSAMTYPMVLLVMTVVVMLILFTFVVPTFADMFEEMETLPVPTKIVMGLSSFVTGHVWGIVIGIFAIFVLYRIVSHLAPVRLQIDRLIACAPGIKKMTNVIYTARFARTLYSLYTSGLPMVTSLAIARNTIGNSYVASQFTEVISFIRAGGTLSEGVAKVKGFTKKLSSSVMIGEETGSLDTMLANIADILDYESEVATTKLITMLEPLMIAIMGAIVGFVIIAVIMPIYGSYATLGA